MNSKKKILTRKISIGKLITENQSINAKLLLSFCEFITNQKLNDINYNVKL